MYVCSIKNKPNPSYCLSLFAFKMTSFIHFEGENYDGGRKGDVTFLIFDNQPHIRTFL